VTPASSLVGDQGGHEEGKVRNEGIGYAHYVGVGGFIVKDDRMLFPRRNREPRIWAPPGGRLLPGEVPLDGLQREIAEECGLQVEVLSPTSVWYGDYADSKVLAIFFLCRYLGGEITLSSESAHAEWLTLGTIEERIQQGTLLGEVEEYERAFKILGCL